MGPVGGASRTVRWNMGIWEHLRRYREARARFEGDAAVAAGMGAEDRLHAQLTERTRSTAWRVWHGVRVPAQGRRRELDFVVTSSDRVFVVELKNWSGVLALDGNRVVQIRTNQQGILDHGRLFDDMDARVSALSQWHRQRSRLVPPIEARVVFANPRLQIEPEVVKRYGHLLMSASEFVAAVGEGASKPLSAEIEAIHETLDALGSWDLVYFHGSQIASGDLRDRGPEVEFQRADGSSLRMRLFDRTRIVRLRVQVRRGILGIFSRNEAFSVVAELRDGERVSAQIAADTVMGFQAAGEREKREIRLVHVEVVEFGYIHRASSRAR